MDEDQWIAKILKRRRKLRIKDIDAIERYTKMKERRIQWENYEKSLPSTLDVTDIQPEARPYHIIRTSRWQEVPPSDLEDFQLVGNSHVAHEKEPGVVSLRQQSASCVAKQARSVTSELLKEVPNPTVWKTVWEAILFDQNDSLNVFLVFAAQLQKHSDFPCHFNGLLHPTQQLSARILTLRALLLRGKSRHRMESVAQPLTAGDVSYLELGIKNIRNELVLSHTRDDLFEHAQHALTRLKSLAVLDLRFNEVSDATLTLWKNALIRGDWPELKVILLGSANADKIAPLLDIPQLWFVGYRGRRLTDRNWFTCRHDIHKDEVPDRLTKAIRCAQNHPSSWLLSSLKELHKQSQNGKLILEVNFSMTSWDLEELRRRPADYVHCVRMRKSEAKVEKPPSTTIKTENKPVYRQVARKRRVDASVGAFFGQVGPKRPCT